MGDLDWSSGWLAGAPVRVLDTVVLDGAGAPRAWFYTSAKSGAVSTKDVAQLTLMHQRCRGSELWQPGKVD